MINTQTVKEALKQTKEELQRVRQEEKRVLDEIDSNEIKKQEIAGEKDRIKREYDTELAAMEEAYTLLQNDLSSYKRRLFALLEDKGTLR